MHVTRKHNIYEKASLVYMYSVCTCVYFPYTYYTYMYMCILELHNLLLIIDQTNRHGHSQLAASSLL